MNIYNPDFQNDFLETATEYNTYFEVFNKFIYQKSKKDVRSCNNRNNYGKNGFQMQELINELLEVLSNLRNFIDKSYTDKRKTVSRR